MLLITHAYAEVNIYNPPTEHAESYLVVGVAGLKTGRDKNETANILSDAIGANFEPSGAWENLNRNHKKIFKNAFLTHFSKDSEIDAVLKLIENQDGQCQKDIGLIMMINSWGAKTSQKLASKYLKKCGRLPHLSVIIEGVSKPTPFAYKKSLLSYNCVNFYQRHSKLKGGPIENCQNNEFNYSDAGMDLFMAHIEVEWLGSQRGNRIIEKYLNENLPVMFVLDHYGIDYMSGLP